MTNIKKLLQILIPGIILAIIVYALFLFFGGTILYLLGLKYNNLLSLAKFFGIFLILSMILDFIVVCFLKVLKELRGLTDTKGVSCSMLTAFRFSIISYLFGIFLEKKSK